ncbi:MAG TPA: LysM peptidoglycan-binding domain-containing protein, partial [Chloroflexota bacterium]|nr:LysM peptidoglycan-binding domain-containing protein [Chloroflexota bacterium]
THERDNGTQDVAFWVLGSPGIPSILVETAFLSNPPEAAKLADAGYQQTLADAINDGLNAYFASGDAIGTPPAAPSDALAPCSGTAAKDDRTQTQPVVRWVETFLPTPLLSGTDAKATQFAMLAPFTFLKLTGQSGNFLSVVNPATNGPGWVDGSKVGPSGPPPPPPPAFQPFWVESFRPTQLWSGTDAGATSFGTAPTWSFFNVLAPSTSSRFQVKVDATGGVAYVDRADVGPSGPPPAPPSPNSTPTPAAAAAPATLAAQPAIRSAAQASSGSSVVVAAGDTLSVIAARVGTSVAALIAANHLTPDGLITVGQKLAIPASSAATSAPAGPQKQASAATITVNPGDTLSSIAAQSGTTIQALVSLNGLSSPDSIQVGQTLKLPSA